MSRYYDSVHLASDQKDLLISQLKAEIFELQQKDKDYMILRDQLHSLEQRYRQLQDEKLLADNDAQTKNNTNQITIQGLKKEGDDLRYLISEKNKQNNDLMNELQSQQDLINRREMEIGGLKSECAQKSDTGSQLRREIDGHQLEAARLRDEHKKDLLELDRLKEMNNIRAQENSDQYQKIKGLEYDIQKAQERHDGLARLCDAKDYEHMKASESLGEAQRELQRLKDEQARLNDDNARLSRLVDSHAAEKGSLSQAKEAEVARNRDHNAACFDFENRLKLRESQLADHRKDLDNVRYGNNAMMDRNADIKAEIDALNNHIRVLEDQNRNLNGELERFVETDEAIRSTLNRRERVNHVRT